MTTFFQELRRRTVIQVVGVYGVIGWLLAQAAVVLQTSLNFPPWFSGVVVGLVLLGLPIAVILAWAFELTPDGIRLTESLPAGAYVPNIKKGRLEYIILLGLALLMSTILFNGRWDATASEGAQNVADTSTSSIAVLPFVDMSEAGDQEYFGDGIAEEILYVLSKSPDLNVMGRTSSFQFREKDMDARIIGEALNVGSIVEGSIRKDGQRIRISAQLVRTSDGVNLWAETYDRDVTRIFQVQDEIAGAIAVQLQASLETGGKPLSSSRSHNVAAYESFLKGNNDYAKRGHSLLDAIASYEKAVALDSNFAAAWANLAVAYSTLPMWLDTSESGKPSAAAIATKSEYAANRAIELDPDLAASQHALGVTLRDRRQWARSEAAFSKASAVAPNAPEILEDYIQLLEMLGRWDDAKKLAIRLTEIDSRTGIYQFRLAIAEWNTGNYEDAIAIFQRMRKVAPETSDNTLPVFIDLIAEAHGIDAASSFLHACKDCQERNPGLVRQVIESAKAQAALAPSALQSNEFEGANYLQLLIGGKDALLSSLERRAANGNLAAVADNTKSISMVRTTQRYKQLVIDLNLARYWSEHGWPSFCKPDGSSDFHCGDDAMQL